MPFRHATKPQTKLRMALIGPSGSGKTYTALAVAQCLGKHIGLIDTERGSASKYADLFTFDVLELTEGFAPAIYVQAIAEAEKAGFDLLIIDSLSHAWAGKGGALEMVDNATKRMQSPNSFAAWREVTPHHNALVDAMLASNLHLIVTMRAKQEYIQTTDDRGKTVIKKVGLQPVQRDGLEYEFDVVADINLEHETIISKTRCPDLTDRVFPKAGKELADILAAWVGSGTKPAPVPRPTVAAPTTPTPTPRASRKAATPSGPACEDCAVIIEADVTFKDGTTYTPAQWAEHTKKHAGKVLCWPCTKARTLKAGQEVAA